MGIVIWSSNGDELDRQQEQLQRGIVIQSSNGDELDRQQQQH